MLKNYIREWLGINYEIKIRDAKINQLQKDLVAITDHFGVTQKVFPWRIFAFQIEAGSITSNKIVAKSV